MGHAMSKFPSECGSVGSIVTSSMTNVRALQEEKREEVERVEREGEKMEVRMGVRVIRLTLTETTFEKLRKL